jgi:peptide/nickel transport system substrate-binding protein
MKNFIILFIVISVIVLIGSSCTDSATTSKSTGTTSSATAATSANNSKYGGTLIYAFTAGPSGVIGYPPEMGAASINIPALCIEPLITFNMSGEMLPSITQSYEVAEDYSSVTLNLRKNIKFHDGSELNADVVKWNLDNAIAAKARADWKSVEVISEYSVKVNLNYWSNSTLNGFDANSVAAYIISKEAYDKNGLDWVRQNPVGTGPFKFASYELDTAFKTTRNPDYWGTDENGNQLPFLDGVDVVIIPDQTTMLLMAKNGDIDLCLAGLGQTSQDYTDVGMYAIAGGVSGSNAGLIPDTANSDSPWSNLLVREAAEYAIDKQAIADAYGYGYWDAVYQLPSPGNPAYVDNADYPLAREYNVEKAKSLLVEAGYSNGFDTTIIMNPNFAEYEDIVLLVQSYWSKIGINAVIEKPQWSKYQPDYLLGTWDNAVLYQVVGSNTNMTSSLQRMFDPNGNFLGSWTRTPEFVELYSELVQSKEYDPALAKEVCDQIIREAAVIFTNLTQSGIAAQTYVKDIRPDDLSGSLVPKYTWLDR